MISLIWLTTHTFGPRKAVPWLVGIMALKVSPSLVRLYANYVNLFNGNIHSTQRRSKGQAGWAAALDTKTWINGNIVLVNSGFHMQNNCSDNYLQFAQVPSRMFSSPVIGRISVLRGTKLFICPGWPHVLDQLWFYNKKHKSFFGHWERRLVYKHMLRRLSVCSLLSTEYKTNHNIKDSKYILWKCGNVQISGNNTTKLKSHPWNNEEQLKFGECLLQFSPESFFSHLLYKNKKIKMYRTVIFYIVLYGCETWSLTLREEHWLRVFKNRLLKKIFGPKRQEVMKTGENCIIKDYKSFVICQILFRWLDEGKWDGLGMWEEGKHEGKRPLRINRHSWEDSITADIKSNGRKWTGLIWLRIGTCGRFFRTWKWTFGFHTM